ncbi:GlxA family transcriptional regulator [Phreatobacter stygius]|uniref:GlxA family transcriptional regulator n=1 Tax=Phreatobacter stygius TaxID=1940610 RepID=A0A4D7AQB0_9HYPH|nr:GlxA family transcriptional regulator [Phreatobacter stygius]QCI63434.1 GlxA family transcriptional regulator [Phreatobacter stygius]
MTKTIGFLVFPSFQILDLSGPLAVFDAPTRALSMAPYRLVVLSEQGGPVTSSSGLEVMTQALGKNPLDGQPLDTLIVAGGAGTREAAKAPALLAFLGQAPERCRRVASVCTGAFVMAAAGLLDGRRATTHWHYAASLQRHNPRIRVEADRIFTKDGPIWTSAGVSSGIDLALALVEDDLGLDIARAIARHLVVYHRRPGGQSQFSTLLELDPPSSRIREALTYARDHLHETLSVERLADVACLSPRQFGRAFLAETGQTPAKAVERLRAEAARARIEAGREPIEAIARGVGFTDPERMRRAFVRAFGQPPQAIRRVARAASAAGSPG